MPHALLVLLAAAPLAAPGGPLIVTHRHAHAHGPGSAHEHPAPAVRDPGYDAAARAAGFTAWGRLGDSRRTPHVTLRLDSGQAVLGVALDSRLGTAAAEAWGARLGARMGWRAAELTVQPHGQSLMVFLKSEDPVRPAAPGQSRATVDLAPVRRALDAVTREPVPVAVRYPGAAWAESRGVVAAHAARDGRYHFLLLESGARLLEATFGLSPAHLGTLAAAFLLLLLLPLGIPGCLRRAGTGPGRFAAASWAGIVGALALAAVLSAPAAAAAGRAIPDTLPVSLRVALAALGLVLPLFLAGFGIELFRPDRRREPGQPFLPGRPAVAAASVVALAAGVPAALLLEPAWRGLSLLAVTPLALALVYEALLQVRSRRRPGPLAAAPSPR